MGYSVWIQGEDGAYDDTDRQRNPLRGNRRAWVRAGPLDRRYRLAVNWRLTC